MELFNGELFRAEPLDVERIFAAEFAGAAAELAMLAAVPVTLVLAVVEAGVAAVDTADWPAAVMGAGLALAVVGLPLVGLLDIAPPAVLFTAGLPVGRLIWPRPAMGLVVTGLGVTRGLLVGAAGKD